MLASPPCDYPRTKKRSLVAETDPFHWTKRTKNNHQPSSFGSWSPTTLPTSYVSPPLPFVQQKPLHDRIMAQALSGPSLDIEMMNDSLKKEPMDEMMVDFSTRPVFSERIDDMETYLNENDDKKDKGSTDQAIDVYSLLQQQPPLKVTMINGVLLPMEQKHGQSKYSIPDFVLRSSTCIKATQPIHPAILMATQNHNDTVDYDPMAMDID